jgi:hypothetical protein
MHSVIVLPETLLYIPHKHKKVFGGYNLAPAAINEVFALFA